MSSPVVCISICTSGRIYEHIILTCLQCMLVFNSFTTDATLNRERKGVLYVDGNAQDLQVTHPVRTLANLARVARFRLVIGKLIIKFPLGKPLAKDSGQKRGVNKTMQLFWKAVFGSLVELLRI